jgi:hypothetical protein
MIYLLTLLLLQSPQNSEKADDASRTFYHVTIDDVNAGKVRHNHIFVEGTVSATPYRAGDRDVHVTIVDEHGHRLVCEIMPELPMRAPKKGQHVRVYGLNRRDPWHGWYEIHPVTKIEVIP